VTRRCIFVRQVTPQSSLLEGGTLLTVEGTNLGYAIDQVQDAVTVVDVPCDVINYTVSTRLYILMYDLCNMLLVHGQVTIIFVVSVCLFVGLSVCLCTVFLSRL